MRSGISRKTNYERNYGLREKANRMLKWLRNTFYTVAVVPTLLNGSKLGVKEGKKINLLKVCQLTFKIRQK
jgi:hypothetical protein